MEDGFKLACSNTETGKRSSRSRTVAHARVRETSLGVVSGGSNGDASAAGSDVEDSDGGDGDAGALAVVGPFSEVFSEASGCVREAFEDTVMTECSD